jgi:nucleoid DNA-binding protein
MKLQLAHPLIPFFSTLTDSNQNRRKARRGRNPKTGEQVLVPAKEVAYFKPGKMLKELIDS